MQLWKVTAHNYSSRTCPVQGRLLWYIRLAFRGYYSWLFQSILIDTITYINPHTKFKVLQFGKGSHSCSPLQGIWQTIRPNFWSISSCSPQPPSTIQRFCRAHPLQFASHVTSNASITKWGSLCLGFGSFGSFRVVLVAWQINRSTRAQKTNGTFCSRLAWATWGSMQTQQFVNPSGKQS